MAGRKPRISPSGPLDGESIPAGTADGQVPTWDNTAKDYVPQLPPSGAGGTPTRGVAWVGTQGAAIVAPNGIPLSMGDSGVFNTFAELIAALTLAGTNPNSVHVNEVDFSAEALATLSGLGVTLIGYGGAPNQLFGGPTLPGTIIDATAVYNCNVGAFQGQGRFYNSAIRTASPLGDLRYAQDCIIIADIADCSNATILRSSFGPCTLGQAGTPRVDEFSLHSMGIQSVQSPLPRTWQVLDTGVVLEAMRDVDFAINMNGIDGLFAPSGVCTAPRTVTVDPTNATTTVQLFRVDNYNNQGGSSLTVTDGLAFTQVIPPFTRAILMSNQVALSLVSTSRLLAS